LVTWEELPSAATTVQHTSRRVRRPQVDARLAAGADIGVLNAAGDLWLTRHACSDTRTSAPGNDLCDVT
jgi:hypothetical protein